MEYTEENSTDNTGKHRGMEQTTESKQKKRKFSQCNNHYLVFYVNLHIKPIILKHFGSKQTEV